MSTDDGDTREDDSREHPPVGSLAEEALRLFGSFAGWAGQQGAEVHHGVEDMARQAFEGVQAMTEDTHDRCTTGATGAAECTWCPWCRTVHAVRELSPEVRTHLISAASSLVKASAALLTTVVPDQSDPSDASSPRPRPRRPPGQPKAQPKIQHIDIDDPDPTT